MEFQQLEMFTAVVEEGSVSRAADRVCRTGPAVSIALRKLEEEMGASLFDRSNRHNLELTETGKVLYEHATRILDLRNAAATSVKESIQRELATLRLGTYESISLYLLPKLLQDFTAADTATRTEIICGASETLLAALKNGRIEVALLADAPEDADLERQLVTKEQLVLIANPTHRLAANGVVHVADLAEEFLLVQGQKSLVRERILAALNETGTPFTLRVENIAIEAIKRMVTDNLGVGFVPQMCVRDEVKRGELVALAVEDISSEWPIWLLRRKDRKLSPAARTFVTQVMAAAARNGASPKRPAAQ